MRTLLPIVLVLLGGAYTGTPVRFCQAQGQTAAGVVYHDRNMNQRRDTGEPGIADVRVSNGREVVRTDKGGKYSLPVGDDTMLFVIKPAGWRTPLGPDRLPRFCYAHKPAGSPKMKEPGFAPTGALPASIDFPLSPQKEPESFQMILFGDPQVRNQQEANYLARDLVAELAGSNAAFGVTLGDVVFNEPSMFGAVNRAIGQIGIPWYSAPGNHDLNFDSPSDDLSLETFRSIYGPRYFSFDYARVHFIVMDTVVFSGATAAEPRGNYSAGIDPDQMIFLRNDLEAVPKDRLVVLLMHYPIVSMEEKLNMKGRQELYRLIEKRPSFSVSAHRHYQDPRIIGPEDGWGGAEPHLHLVHATACGSWWRGLPDEVGIPHATMADGAPNGYSIVNFDGSRYSIRFKAARRPADYQMNVYAPDEVNSGQAGSQEVLANVFAGTDKSVVEMRLGSEGAWIPMKKVLRPDPAYAAMKAAEAKWTPEEVKRWSLPKPIDCPHLWQGMLPAEPPLGTHLLTVRTTDMFGQSYSASHVITIH